MPTNDKFKFVNDINKVEEMDTTEEIIEQKRVETNVINARKKALKRHLKSAAIMLVVSIVLVFLGLFWQDDYSLMAIGDALWLAFALEFFAGWVLFVYNHNIFSPLLYGSKSFVLMFLGKRPKTDYYTYMKRIQDEPVPTYIYIVLFTSAFVLLIPSLITLFILI